MVNWNKEKLKSSFLVTLIAVAIICTSLVSIRVSAQENSDTFNWTREDVSKLTTSINNTAPTINKEELVEITSDSYIWDTWPLQYKNGLPAVVNGYKIIFALSVPKDVLPGKRHDSAEIHYFYSKDGKSWVSGGPIFKDGEALGSRQWAGSALINKDGKVHIFYTATGQKGEETITYEQRLATANAEILTTNSSVTFTNWSDHKVFLEPDGKYYQTVEQTSREESSYSFRDPYFFQDPKTAEEYIVFEANSAGALEERTCQSVSGNVENAKSYNGSIGIVKVVNDRFTEFELLSPLLEANCVNDELERPSIMVKGNHYYLFLKTHSDKFTPGLEAPEGLYGFASSTLVGGYKPLNGSGLVIGNPKSNPYQAYSWMVMSNGTVISFVNYVDVDGKTIEEIGQQAPDYQVEHFGGMLAPSLKLSITGEKTKIIHEKKQGVFK
ncbi:glycoside hydrolase family 68 protein [Litchfieldia salsa]|uniref:Levansucrase n=1 Tax=Litchfieldia salsa TaxID=930152 RepID=A0A1H0VZ42_9BACI|nr:glycoside hydrolase family 68 protein [Litchfieldia salsa]SDP83495.1 levansucrase [Litchfieldia salsa]